MRGSGGPYPIERKQNQPIQLLFNSSPKLDIEGSRVTSECGSIQGTVAVKESLQADYETNDIQLYSAAAKCILSGGRSIIKDLTYCCESRLMTRAEQVWPRASASLLQFPDRWK